MTNQKTTDDCCEDQCCTDECCVDEKQNEKPVLHEGWAGPAAPYPPDKGR